MVVAVVLADIAAGAVVLWLRVGWAGEIPGAGSRSVELHATLIGLVWALTGAALAWLRSGNAVGWLLLGVGSCQVLSGTLAGYGLVGVVAQPTWPGASWAAWLASGLWLPGLLPLANVLPALYPTGRLPGPRWRGPLVAAGAGIVLLTVGVLTSQGVYDDVAPGRSPVAVSLPAGVAILYWCTAGMLLVGGTLAIWVMSGVRLAHARPPERQQLAWLLSIVLVVFGLVLVPGIPEQAWEALLYLFPIAIAVAVFRHNLLGIEVVMRRGWVYGILTAAVAGGYLLATALAGAGLDRGPMPGVLAAALVAVGLAPLRDRLQSGVDRFVYGERRDVIRAVARLGDQVTTAAGGDLLRAVLVSVSNSVRAPGVSVLATDGRPLAAIGAVSDGLAIPLYVSATPIGSLIVAERRPGERYTEPDRRLLDALAPQVAIVVRATELAEALERQRDQVIAATQRERERLRRDLHDGLGPALTGIGLGLQAVAMDPAIAAGSPNAAALIHTMRAQTATAVGDMRRILENLRPAELRAGGLAHAVQRQSAALGPTLPVTVSIDALPELPADVEAAALRITTEALTNVVKHARATHARVDLHMDNDHLRVLITDDGTGFGSTRAEQNPVAVGIESMRQRAETLGGTLAIATSHGGTRVLATLPLAAS